MGDAFAGKKLGKRAMFWGALLQSLPDIDFLESIWADTPDALLGHRGFTHSLLFCALATPLLAWIAERVHRPHNISFKRWALFFGGVIFFHIFIDAFNNYGVGWFEPFTHVRISFHTVYVADPFFSFGPGVALLILLVMKKSWRYRRPVWATGLAWGAGYLLYCIANKVEMDRDFRKSLHDQQISYDRYFTTPAPLQNWLWFVVAGNDSGFHVGYRSVFDKRKTQFTFFPRNAALASKIQNQDDLQKLVRFSQGFYTLEQWNDTLVFNDFRFGQEVGWYDPNGKIAFHYYLNYPEANHLVVQRGRFARWDRHSLWSFLRRIEGK